jgi:hypothetical protein
MSKKERIGIIVFLSLEAFLYFDLLSLDWLRPDSWFQYAAILLCLVFLLVCFRRTQDWLVVAVGIGFSLVADFFLVILQTGQLPATILFCFAQAAFAARFIGKASRTHRKMGVIRLSLFVGLELIGYLVVGTAYDLLAFVSFFYYSLLLGTLFQAGTSYRKYPLFFWGLVFFGLCDLFVGLGSSAGYLTPEPGTLLAWMVNPGFNVAWAFYLPAQTFITLSVYHHEGLPQGKEALSL